MIIQAPNRKGVMFYVCVLMTPMEKKAYAAWQAMIGRCKNPGHTAYSEYGGRGITVCDRWKASFENFLEDVGLPPSNEFSIDRTDPNGNYEPGEVDGVPKVKWASLEEQHRNRRNTLWVEIDGVRKPCSTWAREYGIKKLTMWARVHAGMKGKELLRKTNFNELKHDVGNGRMLSVQEIMAETGMTQTGIWLRLQRGITGPDLLKPSRMKHHKGFRVRTIFSPPSTGTQQSP